MKIRELLQQHLILPELKGTSKTDALSEMALHLSLHQYPLTQNANQILQALLTRERLGSTGVGEGVAIPHAKIKGLQNLLACFGRSNLGIAYDAVDAQPVKLIFMLLVPENCAGAHLKALARISRLLKDAPFRQALLLLEDAKALHEAFSQEDDKHKQL